MRRVRVTQDRPRRGFAEGQGRSLHRNLKRPIPDSRNDPVCTARLSNIPCILVANDSPAAMSLCTSWAENNIEQTKG